MKGISWLTSMSISFICFRPAIIAALFVFFAVLPSYCQNPTQKELAIEERIYFPAAGCDNGKALANFDLPLQGGAHPVCVNRGKPSFLPDRRISAREGAAIEVGTVIVLSVSKEQAILAADSRVGIFSLRGKFKRTDDRYCKLVELTPSLMFAAAGNVKTSGPANILYDSQELARQAARNFVFDPSSMKENETITGIAEKWAWDAAFRIRRGVIRRFYSPPDSGTWVIGVFAGTEPNGEISVAIATLGYHKKRVGMKVPEVSISISVPVPPKDVTWIEAYGYKAVTDKYVSNRRKTDETQTEHQRIRADQLRNPSEFPPRVVRRLIELTFEEDTTQYENGSKKVGGRIDIARITRSGPVEWIARKQACSSRHPKAARPLAKQ
jgi:hypothetical protein